MADPSLYTYPSPLAIYEGQTLEPLPDERNEDGKSYKQLQGQKLSSAYEKFPVEIDSGIRGGFDVHIYYLQQNEEQTKFAKELWERIRREFPELRIYRFWDKPVGPHPIAMFEVNLFSPAQFGAFVSWLVINRGPLSALVHPNTVGLVTGTNDEEERDHTQRATWMGERLPLDLSLFKRIEAAKKAAKLAGKKE